MRIPLYHHTTTPRLKLYASAANATLLVLLLVTAGFWKLGAASPWWDEGWTLSVARTWVERGFYGRLTDGRVAPPGLEAAFPVTDLVALSFRLFGVGVWQGRLPIVLCMFGTVACMAYLAGRLYGRRVAWLTLGILLLLPAHGQLSALLMGRQVLAELPMLCYMLGGYVALLLALRRPWLGLAPAIVLCALALIAKPQAIPFVVASLACSAVLLAAQRRWRWAGIVGGMLLGGWLASYALIAAQQALVHGATLPAAALTDLLSVTALVPDLSLRPVALRTAGVFAPLQVLGIGAALWQFAYGRRLRIDSPEAAVRCSMLLLAAGWLAWFVVFSIGWIRYLLPVACVGSMFGAAWIAQLLGDTRLAALRARRPGGRAGTLSQPAIRSLLAIFLLLALLPSGLRVLYDAYATAPDASAFAAADFLNRQPAGTPIETYESELHFLLNQPYHFPPDQMHVLLAQRAFLEAKTPILYTVDASRNLYIVVGSYGSFFEMYDDILAKGHFKLAKSYGVYRIYRRDDAR